jgi:hypothetical protein
MFLAAVQGAQERVVRIAALHGLRSLIAIVEALRVPLPSVLPAVPPVLHGIVASALETSGNLSPPLAHLLNQSLD